MTPPAGQGRTPELSVVLLSAGYATRLYPLTLETPKALLPLGRGVMLDEVLASVAQVPGVAQTILVSNHRFFGQYAKWQRQRKAAVELIDDGTSTVKTRLGAIRDLALAMERIPPSRDLLVLGTDNLFDWDLADFAGFAAARQPSASIAAWQVASAEEASRCGVVELDADGRLRQFLEKPAQPPSRLVALCVYYFPSAMRRRVQEFLASGGNADAPGFFIAWLSAQERVYGFVAQGRWFDIGTIAAYEEAVGRWGRPVA